MQPDEEMDLLNFLDEVSEPDPIETIFINHLIRTKRMEFLLTWLRSQAKIYFDIIEHEELKIMRTVGTISGLVTRPATKYEITRYLMKYFIECNYLTEFRLANINPEAKNLDMNKVSDQLMTNKDIELVFKR